MLPIISQVDTYKELPFM